jgi:hypothetical protein
MNKMNLNLTHQNLDGELTEEVVSLDLEKVELVEVDFLETVNIETEVFDLEINNTPNYTTKNSLVHNGGGKRKGSIAVYLEPWHADIFDFLELRKNHGK